MRRLLSVLMLSGVLMAPIAMQARDDQRIYDRDRRDYHQWNESENRAYRHWLMEERRRQFHEYNRASRREQRDYWRWRHEHMDWR